MTRDMPFLFELTQTSVEQMGAFLSVPEFFRSVCKSTTFASYSWSYYKRQMLWTFHPVFVRWLESALLDSAGKMSKSFARTLVPFDSTNMNTRLSSGKKLLSKAKTFAIWTRMLTLAALNWLL